MCLTWFSVAMANDENIKVTHISKFVHLKLKYIITRITLIWFNHTVWKKNLLMKNICEEIFWKMIDTTEVRSNYSN